MVDTRGLFVTLVLIVAVSSLFCFSIDKTRPDVLDSLSSGPRVCADHYSRPVHALLTHYACLSHIDMAMIRPNHAALSDVRCGMPELVAFFFRLSKIFPLGRIEASRNILT